MLKKISLTLFIILLLPLVAALFIKNSYDVEREVIINQPVDKVFDYVKHLKNQDQFSKWALMDPNMKKTYRGVDGTVGFVSAWQSDNDEVGSGEQEIMAIIDGQRIDFQLRFLKPFEATSPAYMTTEAIAAKQSKVKWGFSGHLDYPMNLMMLFMDFEQIIGDDLQTGLNNLKALQESQ